MHNIDKKLKLKTSIVNVISKQQYNQSTCKEFYIIY